MHLVDVIALNGTNNKSWYPRYTYFSDETSNSVSGTTLFEMVKCEKGTNQ